jgi:hypothetical protein
MVNRSMIGLIRLCEAVKLLCYPAAFIAGELVLYQQWGIWGVAIGTLLLPITGIVMPFYAAIWLSNYAPAIFTFLLPVVTGLVTGWAGVVLMRRGVDLR